MNSPSFLDLMPFSLTCGVEVDAASPEEVKAHLAWQQERCTAGGILHGGALMTLADTVGGIFAFLNLPDGAATSTVESKTNFLRALRSGNARAVCPPLHVGRQTI